MSNDILNNSYVVGIGGRNLVLQTLGRIYVKVKDKYYELDFQNNKTSTDDGEEVSDIYVVNTAADAKALPYPGDDKLIVGLDGTMFVTTNGNIVEWKIKIPSQDLSLNDLTINGVLTVNNSDGTPLVLNGNPNMPPLIINSSILVDNLNAQFLSGFASTDFAIKNNNETISGTWIFNNINIQGVIGNGNTILDFLNSTLEIDYITVRKGITFPNEGGEELLFTVFGTNEKTFIGKEIIIESVVILDSENADVSLSPYETVSFAITKGRLNTRDEWSDEDASVFWYNIFFVNFSSVNQPPVMRDLTNSAQITYVNGLLLAQGFGTIDSYMSVYYSLFNVNDAFNGLVYGITIINPLEYFDNITTNSVIQTEQNRLGLVLYASLDYLIVQAKILEDDLSSAKKFVVIGNTADPNKKINILFNSIDNYGPFIDILTNYKYNYSITNDDLGLTYNTKLADNSNVKVRLGQLNGLSIDDVFDDFGAQFGIFGNGTITESLNTTEVLDDILEFAKVNKCGVYLKSPAISFNKISLLNPDGSGYLSSGRLLWTKDNLLLQNSKTKNITIEGSKMDQATFNNSNLVAGGDLAGTYPNPTIPQLPGILSRLNNIETRLNNIDSAITAINTTLQSLDERITALGG